MVLNTELLDWESNDLTTRPSLHNESEDSFSNQSEVIVKPMYTKNVKDVKVKSM